MNEIVSVPKVAAPLVQTFQWGPPAVMKTWRWRDKKGGWHAPADMETRHLFFTLRMIWNHNVPPHMRVGQDVRLYTFGPTYSRAYMGEAVFHIGHELAGRTDMSPPWVVEFRAIGDWVETPLFTRAWPLAHRPLKIVR